MSTSTQIAEYYSIDCDKEVAHLLDYAQTKLLTEMPRQLKMVSYLRLCCIAIHKLHQKTIWFGKHRAGAFDTSYPHLLQALCHQNPEWWKLCSIVGVDGASASAEASRNEKRGILKSDDPVIDKLLQPLELFIESYDCKYSTN